MAYRSSMSRERTRQRRRFMWRATGWLVVAGIVGAIGYSSYQTGSVLARQEVTTLQQDIARLTGRQTALRAENTQLRTDLAKSQEAAAALQSRYTRDVPSGGRAELLALVGSRLQAGVTQDRLTQVLQEADTLRPCTAPGTSKRFLIQTQGQGAEQPISLMDGLIVVSASVPATAQNLAKATTVTVTRAWLAQPLKQTGLPLRLPITVNNVQLTLVVDMSNVPGYGAASLTGCIKG